MDIISGWMRIDRLKEFINGHRMKEEDGEDHLEAGSPWNNGFKRSSSVRRLMDRQKVMKVGNRKTTTVLKSKSIKRYLREHDCRNNVGRATIISMCWNPCVQNFRNYTWKSYMWILVFFELQDILHILHHHSFLFINCCLVRALFLFCSLLLAWVCKLLWFSYWRYIFY